MITFIPQTIQESLGVVAHELEKVINSSDFGDTEIELQWGLPMEIYALKKNCFSVGYTVSETEMLPKKRKKKYIECANSFNLLILPCRESALAFEKVNLSVPVKVVPLGANIDHFKYIPRNFQKKPFTFLHMGSLQFRKGSWLLLEAWKDIYPKMDARLLIHDYILRKEAKRLIDYYQDIPGVIWDFDYYSDINELLERAHVLVYPSLAEGWGLPIVEALSTGMPAIVSKTSAMLDYFKDEFGWWISISDDHLPISLLFEETDGYLRVPDIESLKTNMIEAYCNPDKCSKKGYVASQYVSRKLTWEWTYQKLKRTIENELAKSASV